MTLEEEIGLKLEPFETLLDTVSERNIKIISEFINSLNKEKIFMLDCCAGILKSTCLSILMFLEKKTPKESLDLARLEEIY